MDHEHSNDLHHLWWLVLIFIVGVLFYLLSPILTPFLLAGIIAYIFNPLVTKIAAWKIPRSLGTILVITLLLSLFTTLILFLVPLLEREVSRLVDKTPVYLETIRNSLVPWLEKYFSINLKFDTTQLKQLLTQNWQDAGGVLAKLIPSFTSGGVAIMEFFINIVLMPVVLFYLLRDWEHLAKLVDGIIPRHWYGQVNLLVRETDRVLSEFSADNFR